MGLLMLVSPVLTDLLQKRAHIVVRKEKKFRLDRIGKIDDENGITN